MSKFRKLIVFIILSTIVVFILALFSLYRSQMQDVIICSSDNAASYIPSAICSSYLYHFMGDSADIKELEENTGIMIAFDVNKEGINKDKKDKKLFLFLVSKGADVNKQNKITGLYPIHEAILRNNLHAVNLLLSHGADPELKDRKNQLNSLHFTQILIKKNPSINRSSIEKVLLKFRLK